MSETCNIAKCRRVLYCRGLCRNHYDRMVRTGSAVFQCDARVERARDMLAARPMSVQGLADALRISKPTAQRVILEIGAQQLFAASMTASGSGVPTPFYGCMRKEAQAGVSAIHHHLTKRPGLSAKEISALCGLNGHSIRRYMGLLHEMKLVHVVRWTRVEKIYERLWAFGPGEDAEKPRPMTVAERNQKRRLREQVDPELALANRATQRRYRLRHKFKPQRDPLTAAFFGLAA